MKTSPKYLTYTYAGFTALIIAFAIWAFYQTPFGTHVENELFDLRTRIKPDVVPVEGVLRLSINESIVEMFEGKKAERPSLSTLQKILTAARATEAQSFNVILTMEVHQLTPEEMAFLVAMAKDEPRFRLGVLDVDSHVPSIRDLPPPLRQIQSQVFGVDSFKVRTTDIVRNIPTTGFRGREERLLLPAAIAGKALEDFQGAQPLFINYISPSRLKRMSAYEFVHQQTQQAHEDYQGVDLIFNYGQVDNRNTLPRYSYVNTPWQNEKNSLLEGVYLPDFIAICALNFKHATVLNEQHTLFVVLQVIVLTLFCGLVWRLGSSWAFICIVLVWVGGLYLHGLLFSYQNSFIRFGDAALFSTLAALAGSQWRLKKETQLRLRQQVETSAQKDFVRDQGRFLNQYADGLAAINEEILGEAVSINESVGEGSVIRGVYTKFRSSSEELRDYLSAFRQFSAVSREGENFVSKKDFPLRVMVERVKQQFDSKCEEKNIRIYIHFDQNFSVYSDETILEHILFNLVSNAVKYTPEGGRVDIDARRTKREDVVISVTDNGVGVSEKHRKLIFEKFYRIQDDKQIEAKGHGLGLYLCEYFVEKIGGTIDLFSQVGQGSTFFITLFTPFKREKRG